MTEPLDATGGHHEPESLRGDPSELGRQSSPSDRTRAPRVVPGPRGRTGVPALRRPRSMAARRTRAGPWPRHGDRARARPAPGTALVRIAPSSGTPARAAVPCPKWERERPRPEPVRAGPRICSALLASAQDGEQAQQLDVKPHQRDRQPEGGGPGELRRDALLDALLDEVEVEDQAHRGEPDREQPDQDPEDPGAEAEHAVARPEHLEQQVDHNEHEIAA